MWALALVLATIALPNEGASPSSHIEPGTFVELVPLSLDDLYAKRMRFMRGEPMISVGIMEGQRSVTLSADGPARLMYDEAGLPKTTYAPPETRLTFKPLSTKPAQLRYWAVVDTHPYADGERANASLSRWKEEGYDAKLFEVGTIVALQGNVLDTRERHVGIGNFATKEKAEALVAKLIGKAEGQTRPFVHEELVKPPQGVIGVVDESGNVIHRAKDSVYFGTVEGGLVSVSSVEHDRGYASHGREHRKYWGHIYVVIDRDGKIAVVNSVSAEKLLWGLVPAELFPTAPLEALKAQAVTARGEIFSKLGFRHFGEPYHLCSEQHCQVYAGAGYERVETNHAVDETRGLLAVRPRGNEGETLKLVDSVYSSSCGGFSGANEDVWGNAASESLRPKLDGPAEDPALLPFKDGLNDENLRQWLESYPPTECARSSFAKPEKFRWKKAFTAAQADAIVKPLGIGRLKDVKVLGREPGGRITGLILVGTEKETVVPRELPVRKLFGHLNSGMLIVDIARDKKGNLEKLTFTGGGWGHGVGMCQMGAIGRAERNQNFRQILGHYYNGAVVERLY
jgi:SpoIID/LytB domain protein